MYVRVYKTVSLYILIQSVNNSKFFLSKLNMMIMCAVVDQNVIRFKQRSLLLQELSLLFSLFGSNCYCFYVVIAGWWMLLLIVGGRLVVLFFVCFQFLLSVVFTIQLRLPNVLYLKGKSFI